MKKQLLLLALLLSFTFSVSAQKAPKQSKIERGLRKHVTYLASDELEGRRTGEKGATFAAGYVSNMFQRFKLKTGYTDNEGRNSYLQPFEYVSGVEFGPETSMKSDDGKRTLGMRADWAPFIYSPSTNLSSTQTVFAVYGISSARLGYDDYAGLDVNGKIVVVLDGSPGGADPRSPFSAFNVQAKANTAKEKGAIALVVVSAADDLSKERLAQTSFNQTLGETAIPVAIVTRSAGSNLLSLKDGAELSRIEKWLESKPEAAEVRFAGLKTKTV